MLIYEKYLCLITQEKNEKRPVHKPGPLLKGFPRADRSLIFRTWELWKVVSEFVEKKDTNTYKSKSSIKNYKSQNSLLSIKVE